MINSVAFHPTAPILATGSDDKTVKLWQERSNIKSESEFIINNLKNCAKYLQKKYIEFNNSLINKNIEQPDIDKLVEIIKVVKTKEFWEKQDECSKTKKELLTNLNNVKTRLEVNKRNVIISW